MTRDTVVLVRDPITREDGGKHTDYEIYVRTTNIQFNSAESCVRRRFREFVWLRQQLATAGIKNLPDLPPKKILDRFEEDFVEFRRQGLQRFLKELVTMPAVMPERSFHMFLQTSHSTSDIASMLNPTTSPTPSTPDYTWSPQVFVVKDPLSRQMPSNRSSPLTVNHATSMGADSNAGSGSSAGSASLPGGASQYSSFPSTAGPSPVDHHGLLGSLRDEPAQPGSSMPTTPADSRSTTPGDPPRRPSSAHWQQHSPFGSRPHAERKTDSAGMVQVPL
ncbi:sorting nexin-10-like [Sycon ciliatum]|uniref:sorting nexin-10-like n=1 Tax=Sycon ciliatum TaxID=27933 RepID=UPI0020AEC3C3|eukprot:scpid53645/ scgid18218/ Sorting nexin-11